MSKITKQENGQILLTTNDGAEFSYDHVISTIPLGVLHSSVDTSTLDFDLRKRMGIRLLNIEPCVKISLKFKTRWWQDPVKMNNKPIVGGQTFTDMPIRRIVYPSYGLECSDATGSLLVSYTWGQDATRIGARVSPKVPSQKTNMNSISEIELVQEVLDQLTQIHGRIVRQEYMNEFFIMNWDSNPLSMGAFALFGPGQYNTFHRSMIKPEVDGYLHFAGDSTSVYHGWIEGALNSAYRAVMEILVKENMGNRLKQLSKKWGKVEELRYFI